MWNSHTIMLDCSCIAYYISLLQYIKYIFFSFNIIIKITFSQPLSFLIEHTMMTVFMSVGDMFHQWWPFLLFHILIIPTRGSHPVTVVHWTLYPQSDVLTISLLCSQVQFLWNACVTFYKLLKIMFKIHKLLAVKTLIIDKNNYKPTFQSILECLRLWQDIPILISM